ncbi:MAG TPA: N-6 DNA methylase, partial [Candidatus Wallbacteria bacterium]|nr:N-6 DNA methylase [Candidatus Wallbacteria bacterium]
MKPGETYVTVKSEGGLFPAEFLRKLAAGSNDVEFLTPESYYLAPGERINEAISRSWNRMVGVWSNFKNARAGLVEGDAGTSATREGWMLILFQELGYGRLSKSNQIEIDGKQYPVSHIWNNVPIHIVGCNIDLDRRTAGVAGASKMSPFGMVQEFLNRSDNHLWGFVSNGIKLRVLRDNLALSRQACIDFDLEAMMESEAYSDFVILWLLCHQSRVDGARPELCILERWVRTAERQGIRVLETLRDGVAKAIEHLGAGFIAHPANSALREKLKSGTLKTGDYYRQVLRLVYRLLFLFAAEDRDLLMLPANGKFADDIRAARERYMKYYSTKRLRNMASKLRGTKHTDLFRALQVVMNILCGSENSIQIALPALGSFLWTEDSITDIVNCEIENRDFLEAVRSIGFTVDNKVLRPIDYRNIDTEEFGSIFESLLELSPIINSDSGTFELKTLSGNERKTTGSYYTPDSLVQCLLKTALDPVIEEALKKPEPAKAILALKICDPACGSGHFLISAARRMANYLARVYSGGEEPTPDCYRKALRDVAGHCIYGVDLNPMAVELCKVNLWMEALEPGKPLSFLEHHIKCGSSLVGATPKLLYGAPKKYVNGKYELYEGGIPDEAFNPIEGDDKKYCSELKKLNKAHQMNLFEKAGTAKSAANLSDKYENIDNSDDSDLAQIKEMSQKYSDFLNSFDYMHERIICDAWCSAFVWSKTKGGGASPVPMTNSLLALIKDNFKNVDGVILNEIRRLRDQYKFFHWHIEFPDVFKPAAPDAKADNEEMGWNGGFDCVLGNPPWERIKLQEKEFFASKSPEIANAPNAAARKRMIDDLKKNDPSLFQEFCDELRKAEGESHFVRDSKLFPLCGRGDVNTYSIFAELKRNLMGPRGRVGCIVPSGIATDDTTKFFFQSLVEKESLASLFDFENRQALFPGVHRSYKFSLLTLTGLERPSKFGADFA